MKGNCLDKLQLLQKPWCKPKSDNNNNNNNNNNTHCIVY